MLDVEANGQDTLTQKDKDDDPGFVSWKKIELNPVGDNSAAKNTGNMKLIEASECGSSITAPLEENDSYRRWNEMKRNGFLSSSHGGIPVPDRTRQLKKRKSEELKKKKTDPVKKQMEIAKREQIQRFTKIAAPSGLLNGLNPGIITHVRNSKQVHSIIEALVRSERHQSNKKEVNSENTLHQGGYSHTEITERRSYDETCSASQLKSDEMVALESSSSISNKDASNQSSVSSLSARAATVAAEWLELLYQDIEGRLAALQRSKKRIRAVIETELPFLIRKEFSSGECPNSVLPDMHRARWNALFGQMDKTLTEEGRHLESWLKQVKEMQLQCDIGLQCVNSQTLPRSTIMETSEESVVALRAVAASIYSTCNFAKTTGHAHFLV
ncbi:hypothetical protein ACHQM5_020656 [Ranunculus cassubicifolius]